jgi:hypothetical protein
VDLVLGSGHGLVAGDGRGLLLSQPTLGKVRVRIRKNLAVAEVNSLQKQGCLEI